MKNMLAIIGGAVVVLMLLSVVPLLVIGGAIGILITSRWRR